MLRLFLGAVCIGFAPIFVRLVSVGPTPIGFYRCGIAAFLLFGWIIGCKKKEEVSLRYPSRVWRLLILAGALFALDLFVWHRSVLYAGAGLGTILGNTQVFYGALIGVLFYKEKPTLRLFLSILMAFGGIYLLVDFERGASSNAHYYWGVVFGLLTGIVYSSYILVMRKIESLNRSIPTEQALAFVSLLSAGFLLLVCGIEGTLVWPSARDWMWLVCLAVVAQVLGWLLITRNLPKTPVSRAGLVLNAQPVVAVVAGDWILGEKLTHIQAIGAFLTLVAIYLGTQRAKVKRV